jgi:hypothetical protein
MRVRPSSCDSRRWWHTCMAASVLSVLFTGCDARCGRLDASRNPERPPASLTDIDCAPGVARCKNGVVEVSVAAMVPLAQACPFAKQGVCAQRCIADGVDVVANPDVAAARLCVSDTPRTEQLVATWPTALGAAEELRCEDGVVRTNTSDPWIIARCRRGCAAAEFTPEGLSPAIAAELTCNP